MRFLHCGLAIAAACLAVPAVATPPPDHSIPAFNNMTYFAADAAHSFTPGLVAGHRRLDTRHAADNATASRLDRAARAHAVLTTNNPGGVDMFGRPLTIAFAAPRPVQPG